MRKLMQKVDVNCSKMCIINFGGPDHCSYVLYAITYHLSSCGGNFPEVSSKSVRKNGLSKVLFTNCSRKKTVPLFLNPPLCSWCGVRMGVSGSDDN